MRHARPAEPLGAADVMLPPLDDGVAPGLDSLAPLWLSVVPLAPPDPRVPPLTAEPPSPRAPEEPLLSDAPPTVGALEPDPEVAL